MRSFAAIFWGVLGVLSCPLIIGQVITVDGSIDSKVVYFGLWGCMALFLIASVLLGLKRLDRLIKPTANLVLLGVTLALGVLLIEWGLGLFDNPSGYSFKVDSHEFAYEVKINAQGFRDGPFEEKKPGDRLRVLVIGDSFIYGTGVGEADTIPTLMEGTLSKALGKKVEVYNISEPGIGPHQYALLAERFSEVEADYVLLAFYVDNDTSPFPPPTRLEGILNSSRILGILKSIGRKKETFVCNPPKTVHPKYAKLACDLRINPGLMGRGAVGDNQAYYDMLKQRFENEPHTRTSLERIQETFEGRRFGLVVFPSKYQVSTGYFEEMRKLGFTFEKEQTVGRGMQDTVLGWAKQRKIEALDLMPTFTAQSSTVTPSFFSLDDHLTPRGNRVAADAISAWLLPKLKR